MRVLCIPSYHHRVKGPSIFKHAFFMYTCAVTCYFLVAFSVGVSCQFIEHWNVASPTEFGSALPQPLVIHGEFFQSPDSGTDYQCFFEFQQNGEQFQSNASFVDSTKLQCQSPDTGDTVGQAQLLVLASNDMFGTAVMNFTGAGLTNSSAHGNFTVLFKPVFLNLTSSSSTAVGGSTVQLNARGIQSGQAVRVEFEDSLFRLVQAQATAVSSPSGGQWELVIPAWPYTSANTTVSVFVDGLEILSSYGGFKFDYTATWIGSSLSTVSTNTPFSIPIVAAGLDPTKTYTCGISSDVDDSKLASSSVSVDSPSEIRCSFPGWVHGAGFHHLSIFQAGRTLPRLSNDPFLVHFTATVNSATPASIPSMGAATVTVHGQGFNPALGAVYRCTVLANPSGYSVTSQPIPAASHNAISCQLPGWSGPKGPVVVSIAQGTNQVPGFASFNYTSTLVSVQPTVASTIGGLPMRVRGASFDTFSTYMCVFGVGSLQESSSGAVSPVSDSEILCDSPAWQGALPITNFSVRDSGGTLLPTIGSLSIPIRVTTEQWNRVSPTNLHVGGGQSVTVYGVGFEVGGGVTYTCRWQGGQNFLDSAAVTAMSSTQLVCTAPSSPFGSGSVEFSVRRSGSRIAQMITYQSFTYVPLVTAVTSNLNTSSALISRQGGEVVVVTGQGFDSQSSTAYTCVITEGSQSWQSQPVQASSSNELRCTMPANAASASVSLAVWSAGIQAHNQGQFVLSVIPGWTSVTPLSAYSLGGSPIMIIGGGVNGALVKIRFKQVNGGSYKDSTESLGSNGVAQVVAPSWEFGPGPVTATVLKQDENATSFSVFPSSRAVSEFTMEYINTAVSSVSPSVASSQGGTLLTIQVQGDIWSSYSCRLSAQNGLVSATVPASLQGSVLRCASPGWPSVAGMTLLSILVKEDSGNSIELPNLSNNVLTVEILPVVTGLSPSFAPVSGGSTLTVTGQGLGNDLYCRWSFNGTELVRTSAAQVFSSLSVTCPVPEWPGPAGLVVFNLVSATNSSNIVDQSGSDTFAFGPVISSLSPGVILATGGKVYYHGRGFHGSNSSQYSCIITVLDAASQSLNASIVDDGRISCSFGMLSVAAGSGHLSLYFLGQPVLNSRLPIQVSASVQSVAPTSIIAGLQASSQLITLSGAGFVAHASGPALHQYQCKFQSQVDASLSVVASAHSVPSSSQIICFAPDWTFPEQKNVLVQLISHGHVVTVTSVSIDIFAGIHNFRPSSVPATGGLVVIEAQGILANTLYTISIARQGADNSTLKTVSGNSITATQINFILPNLSGEAGPLQLTVRRAGASLNSSNLYVSPNAELRTIPAWSTSNVTSIPVTGGSIQLLGGGLTFNASSYSLRLKRGIHEQFLHADANDANGTSLSFSLSGWNHGEGTVEMQLFTNDNSIVFFSGLSAAINLQMVFISQSVTHISDAVLASPASANSLRIVVVGARTDIAYSCVWKHSQTNVQRHSSPAAIVNVDGVHPPMHAFSCSLPISFQFNDQLLVTLSQGSLPKVQLPNAINVVPGPYVDKTLTLKASLNGKAITLKAGSVPSGSFGHSCLIQSSLSGSESALLLESAKSQFAIIASKESKAFTTLNANTLTISAMVYLLSAPSSPVMLVGNRNSASAQNAGVSLDILSGSLGVQTASQGVMFARVRLCVHFLNQQECLFPSLDILRSREWHHIAGSVNGVTGEMSVFVDGQQVGHTFSSGRMISYDYAEDWVTGADKQAAVFLNGMVDSVSIFTSVLKASQVAALASGKLSSSLLSQAAAFIGFDDASVGGPFHSLGEIRPHETVGKNSSRTIVRGVQTSLVASMGAVVDGGQIVCSLGHAADDLVEGSYSVITQGGILSSTPQAIIHDHMSSFESNVSFPCVNNACPQLLNISGQSSLLSTHDGHNVVVLPPGALLNVKVSQLVLGLSYSVQMLVAVSNQSGQISVEGLGDSRSSFFIPFTGAFEQIKLIPSLPQSSNAIIRIENTGSINVFIDLLEVKGMSFGPLQSPLSIAARADFVNPSTTSAAGGSMITIRGSAFDVRSLDTAGGSRQYLSLYSSMSPRSQPMLTSAGQGRSGLTSIPSMTPNWPSEGGFADLSLITAALDSFMIDEANINILCDGTENMVVFAYESGTSNVLLASLNIGKQSVSMLSQATTTGTVQLIRTVHSSQGFSGAIVATESHFLAFDKFLNLKFSMLQSGIKDIKSSILNGGHYAVLSVLDGGSCSLQFVNMVSWALFSTPAQVCSSFVAGAAFHIAAPGGSSTQSAKAVLSTDKDTSVWDLESQSLGSPLNIVGPTHRSALRGHQVEFSVVSNLLFVLDKSSSNSSVIHGVDVHANGTLIPLISDDTFGHVSELTTADLLGAPILLIGVPFSSVEVAYINVNHRALQVVMTVGVSAVDHIVVPSGSRCMSNSASSLLTVQLSSTSESNSASANLRSSSRFLHIGPAEQSKMIVDLRAIVNRVSNWDMFNSYLSVQGAGFSPSLGYSAEVIVLGVNGEASVASNSVSLISSSSSELTFLMSQWTLGQVTGNVVIKDTNGNQVSTIGDVNITAHAIVSNITSRRVSLSGGERITVTGVAFENSNIPVCKFEAEGGNIAVNSSAEWISYTRIVCIMPSNLNVQQGIGSLQIIDWRTGQPLAGPSFSFLNFEAQLLSLQPKAWAASASVTIVVEAVGLIPGQAYFCSVTGTGATVNSVPMIASRPRESVICVLPPWPGLPGQALVTIKAAANETVVGKSALEAHVVSISPSEVDLSATGSLFTVSSAPGTSVSSCSVSSYWSSVSTLFGQGGSGRVTFSNISIPSFSLSVYARMPSTFDVTNSSSSIFLLQFMNESVSVLPSASGLQLCTVTATNESCSSHVPINKNTFTQVTLTKSGNSFSLFVGSQQVAQSELSLLANVTVPSILLGHSFDGLLDELSIWSNALSSGDIMQNSARAFLYSNRPVTLLASFGLGEQDENFYESVHFEYIARQGVSPLVADVSNSFKSSSVSSTATGGNCYFATALGNLFAEGQLKVTATILIGQVAVHVSQGAFIFGKSSISTFSPKALSANGSVLHFSGIGLDDQATVVCSIFREKHMAFASSHVTGDNSFDCSFGPLHMPAGEVELGTLSLQRLSRRDATIVSPGNTQSIFFTVPQHGMSQNQYILLLGSLSSSVAVMDASIGFTAVRVVGSAPSGCSGEVVISSQRVFAVVSMQCDVGGETQVWVFNADSQSFSVVASHSNLNIVKFVWPVGSPGVVVGVPAHGGNLIAYSVTSNGLVIAGQYTASGTKDAAGVTSPAGRHYIVAAISSGVLVLQWNPVTSFYNSVGIFALPSPVLSVAVSSVHGNSSASASDAIILLAQTSAHGLQAAQVDVVDGNLLSAWATNTSHVAPLNFLSSAGLKDENGAYFVGLGENNTLHTLHVSCSGVAVAMLVDTSSMDTATHLSVAHIRDKMSFPMLTFNSTGSTIARLRQGEFKVSSRATLLPSVHEISPSLFPAAAGLSVTIRGLGFNVQDAMTKCVIGGVQYLPNVISLDVVVCNLTQPPSTVGIVPSTAISSVPTVGTVEATIVPAILTILPSTVDRSHPSLITVIGNHFSSNMQCFVNGTQGLVVSVPDEHTLVCLPPAMPSLHGLVSLDLFLLQSANLSFKALSTEFSSLSVMYVDINVAPQFVSTPATVTLNEPKSDLTINVDGAVLVGSPEEVISQSFNVSATLVSSDATLPLLINNVSTSSGSSNFTISLTIPSHAHGKAIMSIAVVDSGGVQYGGVDKAMQNLTVFVTGSADQPSILSPLNVTVPEDAGMQDVHLTVSPGPLELSEFVLVSIASIDSSDSGLFDPNGGSPYLVGGQFVNVKMGQIVTLRFKPSANAWGTATVVLNLLDSSFTSASQNFTISIQPLNDAPTVSTDSIVVFEGAPFVSFTISSGNGESLHQALANTSVQVLNESFAGMLSNIQVLPDPHTLGQTLVILNLTQDAFGTSLVEVSATDVGGQFTLATVNITVIDVPDRPSFELVSDSFIVPEGIFGGLLSITVAVNISAGNFEQQEGLFFSLVSLIGDTHAFLAPPVLLPNGTLLLAPVSKANGVLNISAVAVDSSGLTSAPQKFTVSLIPVNDPPVSLNPESLHVSVVEGTDLASIPLHFSPGPQNEANQTLSFGLLSVNGTGLVQNASISGTLLLVSLVPHRNGNASFTISVTDNGGTANGGQNAIVVIATLQVLAVNDPPSFAFTNSGQFSTEEDSATVVFQGAASFISSGPHEMDSLSFSVSVVAGSHILASAPVLDVISGNLSLLLQPDRFGDVVISAVLSDGHLLSQPMTATIHVHPVNDPPSFSGTLSPIVQVLEDSGNAVFQNFLVMPSAGPWEDQALVINATSDNTALFSSQPTMDNNGTLRFAPALHEYGNATVTVVLSDGSTSQVNATFIIAVLPVNDGPSFVLSHSSIVVLEDAGAVSIHSFVHSISAGFNEPGDGLNQTLSWHLQKKSQEGPFSQLFESQGEPSLDLNGTLKFTTLTNANGVATYSLYLSDGAGGQSSTVIFNISIITVNDAPSATVAMPSILVAEDQGFVRMQDVLINVSPGPSDELAQLVSFACSNDAPSGFFVQQPILTKACLSNPCSTADLTFQTTSHIHGSVNVSCTVRDNAGHASGGIDFFPVNISLTVIPVNDAPVINVADVTVHEDSGAHTFARHISLSSPNFEDGQTTTISLVSISSQQLFSSLPSIDQNGTLTFTLKPDQFGQSIVTVQARDNGGTLNGGFNSSSAFFRINVIAVNDVPSFVVPLPHVTVLEDTGSVTLSSFAVNATAGPNEHNVLRYSVVVLNGSHIFSSSPTVTSDGSLHLHLANNRNGQAWLDVVLSDGLATLSIQASVTVVPVNDAPSFTISQRSLQVVEDFGQAVFHNFIEDVSAGPHEDVEQTIMLKIDVSGDDILGASPVVDLISGDLILQSAPDRSGVAIIHLCIEDNGGSANGGSNQTCVEDIRINVAEVNDPPEIFLVDTFSVAEDSGASRLAGVAAVSPMAKVLTTTKVQMKVNDSDASVSFSDFSIDSVLSRLPSTVVSIATDDSNALEPLVFAADAANIASLGVYRVPTAVEKSARQISRISSGAVTITLSQSDTTVVNGACNVAGWHSRAASVDRFFIVTGCPDLHHPNFWPVEQAQNPSLLQKPVAHWVFSYDRVSRDKSVQPVEGIHGGHIVGDPTIVDLGVPGQLTEGLLCHGSITGSSPQDGVVQVVADANIPSLAIGSQISVEATVFVAGMGARGGIVSAVQDNNGYQKGYILELGSDNKLHFKVATEFSDDGDGKFAVASSLTSTVVGNGIHAVGTYDGSRVRLFINGQLEGDVQACSIPPCGSIQFPSSSSPSAPFAIGALVDSNEITTFNGIVREVRLFQRAVTASEVTSLFSAISNLISKVFAGAPVARSLQPVSLLTDSAAAVTVTGTSLSSVDSCSASFHGSGIHRGSIISVPGTPSIVSDTQVICSLPPWTHGSSVATIVLFASTKPVASTSRALSLAYRLASTFITYGNMSVTQALPDDIRDASSVAHVRAYDTDLVLVSKFNAMQTGDSRAVVLSVPDSLSGSASIVTKLEGTGSANDLADVSADVSENDGSVAAVFASWQGNSLVYVSSSPNAWQLIGQISLQQAVRVAVHSSGNGFIIILCSPIVCQSYQLIGSDVKKVEGSSFSLGSFTERVLPMTVAFELLQGADLHAIVALSNGLIHTLQVSSQSGALSIANTFNVTSALESISSFTVQGDSYMVVPSPAGNSVLLSWTGTQWSPSGISPSVVAPAALVAGVAASSGRLTLLPLQTTQNSLANARAISGSLSTSPSFGKPLQVAICPLSGILFMLSEGGKLSLFTYTESSGVTILRSQSNWNGAVSFAALCDSTLLSVADKLSSSIRMASFQESSPWNVQQTSSVSSSQLPGGFGLHSLSAVATDADGTYVAATSFSDSALSLFKVNGAALDHVDTLAAGMRLAAGQTTLQPLMQEAVLPVKGMCNLDTLDMGEIGLILALSSGCSSAQQNAVVLYIKPKSGAAAGSWQFMQSLANTEGRSTVTLAINPANGKATLFVGLFSSSSNQILKLSLVFEFHSNTMSFLKSAEIPAVGVKDIKAFVMQESLHVLFAEENNGQTNSIDSRLYAYADGHWSQKWAFAGPGVSAVAHKMVGNTHLIAIGRRVSGADYEVPSAIYIWNPEQSQWIQSDTFLAPGVTSLQFSDVSGMHILAATVSRNSSSLSANSLLFKLVPSVGSLQHVQSIATTSATSLHVVKTVDEGTFLAVVDSANAFKLLQWDGEVRFGDILSAPCDGPFAVPRAAAVTKQVSSVLPSLQSVRWSRPCGNGCIAVAHQEGLSIFQLSFRDRMMLSLSAPTSVVIDARLPSVFVGGLQSSSVSGFKVVSDKLIHGGTVSHSNLRSVSSLSVKDFGAGGTFVSAFSSLPSDEKGQSVVSSVITTSGSHLLQGPVEILPSGIVTVAVSPNMHGAVSLQATVHDSLGMSAVNRPSSVLRITPVVDAPSLSVLLPVVTHNVAVAKMVKVNSVLNVSSQDGDGALIITIQSVSNPTIFSSSPVFDADGNLVFGVNETSQGISQVVARAEILAPVASGGGLNVSDFVNVTINLRVVNRPPSFAFTQNITVHENVGKVTIPGIISTNVTGPGEGGELGQELVGYTLQSVLNASSGHNLFASPFFKVQPFLALDGTLSFEVLPGLYGSVELTFVLKDDGGVENGGVDTSLPMTVRLDVLAVNDPPQATLLDGSTVVNLQEGAGQVGLDLVMSAGLGDKGQFISSVQVTSISNPSLFASAPTAGMPGVLNFTIASAGVYGTSNVTVTLVDNTGQQSAVQVQINVEDVNSPPSVSVRPKVVLLPSEDGCYKVLDFVTSTSSGNDAYEQANQQVHLMVESVAPLGFFTENPRAFTNGTLVFSTKPGLTGPFSLSVFAEDDGSRSIGSFKSGTVEAMVFILPSPQIHSVSPTIGPFKSSGYNVTITGQGFGSLASRGYQTSGDLPYQNLAVTFGPIVSPLVTVKSDSVVIVSAPDSIIGQVDITVTITDGPGPRSFTLLNAFTFSDLLFGGVSDHTMTSDRGFVGYGPPDLVLLNPSASNMTSNLTVAIPSNNTTLSSNRTKLVLPLLGKAPRAGLWSAHAGVIVAGNFLRAGRSGQHVNHIGKWDGRQWLPIGYGTDGPVHSLVQWGQDLVVAGGAFTRAFTPRETSALGGPLAAWSLSRRKWMTLTSCQASGVVNALTVQGNQRLIVAGRFSAVCGMQASGIAHAIQGNNSFVWNTFGSGLTGGHVMSVSAGLIDVFAAGSFTHAGGLSSPGIARWDGSSWQALGGGVARGTVQAIALQGQAVFIAGDFSAVDGDLVPAAGVAMWHGGAWHALRGGLTGPGHSLALQSQGCVVVGGSFNAVDGIPAKGLARFCGASPEGAWEVMDVPDSTTSVRFVAQVA